MKRLAQFKILMLLGCQLMLLSTIAIGNPMSAVAAPMQPCSCGNADCSGCEQAASFGWRSIGRRCPECDNDHCVLELETISEEKTCYKTEQKAVCIPSVRLPWQRDCPPYTSRSRTVTVLKKHTYKCEKCAYMWKESQPVVPSDETLRPAETYYPQVPTQGYDQFNSSVPSYSNPPSPTYPLPNYRSPNYPSSNFPPSPAYLPSSYQYETEATGSNAAEMYVPARIEPSYLPNRIWNDPALQPNLISPPAYSPYPKATGISEPQGYAGGTITKFSDGATDYSKPKSWNHLSPIPPAPIADANSGQYPLSDRIPLSNR